MKNDDIYNDIVSWGEEITNKYPGLSMRFEYSDTRNVFLVALYPDDIDDMEQFSSDVMSFEDQMEAKYGYDAPLFCDNEELFTLTLEARMITGKGIQSEDLEWYFQLDDNYIDTVSLNLAA